MRNYRNTRSSRGRFLWGVVLLIVGSCLLAANLGLDISGYVWDYWPFLLISIGGVQLAWPGAWHERLGGYWLMVLGVWGAINNYEWFGLHWGNSWPIFIIAFGLRVLLGGVLRSRVKTQTLSNETSSSSGSPSGPSAS